MREREGGIGREEEEDWRVEGSLFVITLDVVYKF